MKRSTFAISLALVCAALDSTATAQRYDPRIDVPRLVNPERDFTERDYRGGDWELRVRTDLDRLNGEVARVRREIGDSRDRRIRARFNDILRANERLNYAFERRQIRGWEVRRRADEIRAQLDHLRREMRGRYDGRREREPPR